MVIGKAAVFITAHAGCVSRPSVSHGLRRASDDALGVTAHAGCVSRPFVSHGVPQEWHLNNCWAGHLIMPYAVWKFLYISQKFISLQPQVVEDLENSNTTACN